MLLIVLGELGKSAKRSKMSLCHSPRHILRICLGQSKSADPPQLQSRALQTVLSTCSTDCCLSQLLCKRHYLIPGKFLKNNSSAYGTRQNLSDLMKNCLQSSLCSFCPLTTGAILSTLPRWHPPLTLRGYHPSSHHQTPLQVTLVAGWCSPALQICRVYSKPELFLASRHS